MDKTFRVVMSERCFRLKPDALPNHAPPRPGVYELVTFDENRQAKVLYVGLALSNSVYDCLAGHLSGQRAPAMNDLLKVSKDIYFDYVANAEIGGIEDLKDIAAALKAKHNPPFNTEPIPGSGKYSSVAIEEVELL